MSQQGLVCAEATKAGSAASTQDGSQVDAYALQISILISWNREVFSK